MGLRGPIVAATDLSDAADAALRQGHAIATSLGVPLIVCHVLPEAYRTRMLFPQEAGIDVTDQRQLEARAREVIGERIAQVLPAAPGTVSIELESGSAHSGILAAAERAGAGLVVVGPGRTAVRVARSTGPILVARPSPDHGAVLGATDFSDPSLPAVRMAADEATRRGARLRLIHCLDIDPTAYLAPAGAPGMMPITPLPQGVFEQLETDARERLAAALAATGRDGEQVILPRPPTMGIVESAQATATALVVVGTRGRSALARFALGSVAEEVMGDAPCSVLVVPLHPA